MKSIYHFLFLVVTVGGAAAVSLIGGIGLESVSDELVLVVPLLVAVPSLNNLAGDYAAISAAHVSDPLENARDLRSVRKAINWAMLINVVGIVAISCGIAVFRGYALDAWFVLRFGLFVGLAVWSVVCGIFWVNRVLNRLLKSHRLNSDDILIPVATALADIAMLSLATLAIVTIF